MVKQQHDKQNAESMTMESALPALPSMDDILKRIKPAAETAEALRAGIAQAHLVAEELAALVADTEIEALSRFISGTPSELSQAEKLEKEAHALITRVRKYEAAMKLSLERREELDRQAVIDDALARGLALKSEADLASEEFSAAWHRDYPAAASAIVALLKLEDKAVERYAKATAALNRAKELGAQLPVELPKHPTRVALGLLNRVKKIGDVVQLPGVYGAPFIPFESETRMETVMVQYKDWDAPQGKWVPDHLGERMTAPLIEKEVQRPVTEYKPIREDRPFWVRLGTPLDGSSQLRGLI